MRIKREKPEMAEVDMTPMIDIVFQLIAFFMVITNFENQKADERVKLPRNSIAKPDQVKRENELVLNVGFNRNKAGVIQSGPFVFYASENVPIEKMAAALKREGILFIDTGKKIEDVTVVIRADREVPAGLVQKLIKTAKETKVGKEGHGYQKFALKATQSAPDASG